MIAALQSRPDYTENTDMCQRVSKHIFRMDKTLKTDMEKVCKAMGLSATSAYTIFAKKVCLEKRIPFEITVDTFYGKENTAYLTRTISDIESGNIKLTEHKLIEE